MTREALDLGFDLCRAMIPGDVSVQAERLRTFLALDRHAGMDWMASTAARRQDPKTLWPDVRSIFVLGMNYGPDCDPLRTLSLPDRGTISVYARNRDYHDVMKGKLKQLAGKLATRAACDVKVFVDTAPVMEKPMAESAGLGWQGKHTNLVARNFGSWLFLGSIFTTLDLGPDAPEPDRCGSCRKCLDVCPTNAFPAPYQLDANRCISYLTIEHKGTIAPELRPAIGNRIYGCDDCLAVCPWNKFASRAAEAKLQARDDLQAPDLADLAGLDDAAFRAFFSGSPVKRIGRDRFVRNVLIAIGNSGELRLADAAVALLGDAAPQVRAMAVWALARLVDANTFQDLAARQLPDEHDAEVRAEWTSGLDHSNVSIQTDLPAQTG